MSAQFLSTFERTLWRFIHFHEDLTVDNLSYIWRSGRRLSEFNIVLIIICCWKMYNTSSICVGSEIHKFISCKMYMVLYWSWANTSLYGRVLRTDHHCLVIISYIGSSWESAIGLGGLELKLMIFIDWNSSNLELAFACFLWACIFKTPVFYVTRVYAQPSKSGWSYGISKAGASGSTSNFTSSTQDLYDSYNIWIFVIKWNQKSLLESVGSVFHTENDTLASVVSSRFDWSGWRRLSSLYSAKLTLLKILRRKRTTCSKLLFWSNCL